MNSNAALLDNPEHAREALMRHEGQNTADGAFNHAIRLARQAQYDNSGIMRRRVVLDVGKVEVESNEGALFARADVDDTCVAFSTE